MGQADQEQGSEEKEDNAGEKRRVKERGETESGVCQKSEGEVKPGVVNAGKNREKATT